MANEFNNDIKDITISWDGCTGEQVEDFIKNQLSNLEDSKVGYIHKDDESGNVYFYANKETYENDENGNKAIGSVISKARYTLTVKQSIDNKKIFISGDKNKKFVWYFKTTDNQRNDIIVGEPVNVIYTVNNQSTNDGVKTYQKTINYVENDENGFMRVEENLDDYLKNGISTFNLEITGTVSKETGVVNAGENGITIVLLEATDNTNFHKTITGNSITINTKVSITNGVKFKYPRFIL